MNEDGECEYVSEGEYQAMEQVAMQEQFGAMEDDEEDILCDQDDALPALVVSKVLTTHPHVEEDQRCNLFQTRAGIQGRSIKVIIDGGSCHNLARTELCAKLKLPLKKHPSLSCAMAK